MGGKPNTDQRELLLDYMERHRELAVGRFLGPNGAETSKKLWLMLTGRLNLLGTTKDYKEWQRLWCIMKKNARSQYFAERKKALTATGNRKPAPILNSNNERIICLMAGRRFAGLRSVTEDGIPQNRATTKAKPFHTANLDDSTTPMTSHGSSHREKRPVLMSGIINTQNQQKITGKSQMVLAWSNSAGLKALEDSDKTLKEVIENTIKVEKSVQNVAETVRIECEKIVEAIYEVATTKLNVLTEALISEHAVSMGRLIADDAT